MRELAQLNSYLRRYKWHLLGGFLFVGISNVFAILPAQIIRYAIDFIRDNLVVHALFQQPEFLDGFTDTLVRAIIIFSVVIILLALAKGFFMYLMRQTIIVMSRLIEFDMKNELFDKYQRLHMGFYKQNNTGDLMNRISEDVGRVRMYFGPAIMYTINLVVLFVMVVLTMLSVNPTLTAYVLIPLPVLYVLIYWVSKQINVRSERVQQKLSDLSTFTQEAFSGIRVIKAYNRLNEREREFSAHCDGYKSSALELVQVNAMFMPAMILLIGLSTILTVYVGGRLTLEGSLSAGNIAEFVIYVNMLTWPVASVGWVTSLVQRAAASQKRINEFMNTAVEIQNPTQESFDFKGRLEFRHVNFTYPDSGIRALQDVSFVIEPGYSVAVIGPTGSGKSTLANLICRLYDADSGEILVDGRDLRSVNLDAYRSSIGYVPQEVYLFSDTIANNISFSTAEPGRSPGAMEQAARDASIFSNVVEFPQGFETRVGERGVTLSGGQKQRISIARAVIKSPTLLLFDDCLSAVDTRTEEVILTNLREIMKGKSSLIISHRVSSVRFCDEIIVLNDGAIVERGTHVELLKLEGFYKDMYVHQQLDSVTEA